MKTFLKNIYILSTAALIGIVLTIGISFVLLYNPPFSENDIQIFFYSRKNSHEAKILKPGSNFTSLLEDFNRTELTVMFIHGWYSNFSKSPTEFKEAFLNKTTNNFIVVDWTRVARSIWYYKVVKQIPLVGAYIVKLLYELHESKYISTSNLYIIGFSLGSHISGIIGHELQQKKLPKVSRITGLDPTDVIIDLEDEIHVLDKSDAEFVDVIHTDLTLFGTEKAIGHADFYVNPKNVQKSCKWKIGCNHKAAWQYYIKSIYSPKGFPALKCYASTFKTFDNCTNDEKNFMGIFANSMSRGIYKFAT